MRSWNKSALPLQDFLQEAALFLRLFLLHRYRFSQIARFVYVCAFGAGGVVGEQLQRYGVQDGAECAVVLGHADGVYAFFAVDLAVGIG